MFPVPGFSLFDREKTTKFHIKLLSIALFFCYYYKSSYFFYIFPGEDSGRVVIWNMAPILSEAKEVDSRVPLMLCTLDNHLACVNAVRWSNSGRYLASGGDDKLIMIWTISKSQGNELALLYV